MRRFILPPETFTGNGTVTVTGAPFRHMARALRLAAGDRVLLADGSGREFRGTIRRVEAASLAVDLEELAPQATPEAGPRLTLLQGLPKGDKMDLIVQKATELGVAAIVPLLAGRSVPRLAPERSAARLERWRRIAREAARQSGRATVPVVAPLQTLPEALRLSAAELRLFLWEGEREHHLRTVLAATSPPASVELLVGPEGGFSAAEAAAATAGGFSPTCLGRRILRTETAGLAVLAVLQYLWGDLG